MSHLSETGHGYFEHLLRSWKVAGVLLVHGLLPNVWKTKASDLLCVNSNATRKYLLEKLLEIGDGEFIWKGGFIEYVFFFA